VPPYSEQRTRHTRAAAWDQHLPACRSPSKLAPPGPRREGEVSNEGPVTHAGTPRAPRPLCTSGPRGAATRGRFLAQAWLPAPRPCAGTGAAAGSRAPPPPPPPSPRPCAPTAPAAAAPTPGPPRWPSRRSLRLPAAPQGLGMVAWSLTPVPRSLRGPSGLAGVRRSACTSPRSSLSKPAVHKRKREGGECQEPLRRLAETIVTVHSSHGAGQELILVLLTSVQEPGLVRSGVCTWLGKMARALQGCSCLGARGVPFRNPASNEGALIRLPARHDHGVVHDFQRQGAHELLGRIDGLPGVHPGGPFLGLLPSHPSACGSISLSSSRSSRGLLWNETDLPGGRERAREPQAVSWDELICCP